MNRLAEVDVGPSSGEKHLRLKLSEWASIAEIIGAIAVIVSLIYVGYQVNDNTSAIRSAAANDAYWTLLQP